MADLPVEELAQIRRAQQICPRCRAGAPLAPLGPENHYFHPVTEGRPPDAPAGAGFMEECPASAIWSALKSTRRGEGR